MAEKSTNSKSVAQAGTNKLICDRCKVEMEEIGVHFKYLSRNFRYKVPRCPKCGQVSIPEDLVKGKMANVEAIIEEK
ncbi:MAG: DNA-binding protein [Clostridiales bacterium]|nr:DNA-binding protein [Clostridiales bacterium]